MIKNMSYTFNNSASSSRPSDVYRFTRSATPPRIRSGSPMGRAFPQSLPYVNYPQDSDTGLRDNDGKEFAYLQDLTIGNTTSRGINSPQVVTLNEEEYIYKKTYVAQVSLPSEHERDIQFMTSPWGNTRSVYYSNSRAMAQIMSRNLLELFTAYKEDIILPKMFPVVDSDNDEVCGIISEKIVLERLSYDDIDIIYNKCEKNDILLVMKILSIRDVSVVDEIQNVGLTKDKELVFFDFGSNILDEEYNERYSQAKLSRPSYYEGNFATTAQNLVNNYFRGYGTKNNEETGLAETIDPDIDNVIMKSGPGDEDFRKEIATIIQTRINMVIEDAKAAETDSDDNNN